MESKLRRGYYQLPIGVNDDLDQVWVKKLKLILESDIHKKPLGCKINDTHMKIGNVHMSSFYEAQILFSHARWVGRFSGWLNRMMREDIKNTTKNIVIIGYETYTEPVLYALKNKLQQNSEWNVHYGIYEEPKFIQNKAGTKTNIRIRYIENIKDIVSPNCTQVFFVCGISSTLSTFKKMNDFFKKNVANISTDIVCDWICYSLIQVLPVGSGEPYGLKWEKDAIFEKKTAISEKYGITAKYLVDVDCEWYIAEECPLCFPDNPIDEKPIIQTSETSIVPIQMIEPNSSMSNDPKDTIDKTLIKKINFFKKRGNQYKYKDFLYYDHIDRMDHHYKYYIRTGHLLKKILSQNNEKKKFVEICDEIKKSIFDPKEAVNGSNSSKKTVNIVISPAHFSDEVFPNVINQYVFDGKAHMISFDPQKEYRSNFETKYSNFAYFLEQTKASNEPVDIHFYYVDDQLTSGDHYYRAKSLIKSLMSENHILSPNIKVFDAVIIFLSRISNSTKMDYVDDIKRYFSFIDISIPSIRNYGDSCPICKLRQDAAIYTQSSTLNICAEHWANKHWYHLAKSLEEVKCARNLQNETDRELLSERHFRRLECENILWEETRGCCSEKEFFDKIINAINTQQDKSSEIDSEYFISFIKAMAVPFLYYKENEKKAALKILLSCITQIIGISGSAISYDIRIVSHLFKIKFSNNYEKYSLIVVLINCLAEMDSSYLLNAKRISELCDTVYKINDQLLSYKKISLDGYNVDGFYSVIVNACKRIVCGISGTSKINHFDKELVKVLNNNLFDSKFSVLWKILYLENNIDSISENDFEAQFKQMQENQRSSTTNMLNKCILATLEKYDHISEMLKGIFEDNSVNISFYYYDSTLQSRWFPLQKAGYEKDVNIDKDCLELLQSIPVEGVVWSEKACAFLLHHYNIDGITNSSINTDEQAIQKKEVFLYFSFNSNIEINHLFFIRKVLQYRYALCKEIANDISADAIKVAIQAKAAEDLLKSDKAISHGAMEELNLLFTQATSLIDATYREGERLDSSQFKNICNSINIFMNRCIGYSNTHQIVQQYFSTSNGDGCHSIETPFFNTVQQTAHSEWCEGWSFFEEYLNELASPNHCYLNGLAQIKNRNYRVNVSFEQEINAIINSIKNSDKIPFFLNSGGADAKYGVVFLIGILDIMFRNAIKHGVYTDSTLNISFKVENDEYPGPYRILVLNPKTSTESNPGITKKFFELINNSMAFETSLESNHFKVEIGKENCSQNNMHIAALEIVQPFIGSEDK